MYYYDLASSVVKTATHARFDEGMNDLVQPPPNVQSLRNLDPSHVGPAEILDLPTIDLDVTDDPFDRLDSLSPAIVCEHPTLGFEVSECHVRRRSYVSAIAPHTTASRIRNVRRKYIGAFIVSINGTAVFTADEIKSALQAVSASDDQTFEILFAPDRSISAPTAA